MKALWFIHLPTNASKYLGYNTDRCGWIGSLEDEIKKNNQVELAVAFYFHKKIEPFSEEGVKYYPIYGGLNSKIKKLIFKLKGNIESKDDIDKYIDIIDNFKPDVIHVHGTEGPFGLIAPRIKIPVVISIQGNLTVSNMKYYAGISKQDIRRNLDLKSIIRIKHFIFHKRSFEKKAKREKKILKNAKYIIGRTDWDRRITRVLAPESKYFHGDEMLRPSFYSHKWKMHKNSDRIVVFSTIGDNVYKGIETIWQSLKHLNQKEKIIWRVAGIDENSQMIRILMKKFNENIPSNLNLLGSLSEDKMVEELLNSDIYVHPSHIENSPNSVCEAMILGMPIISTFSGGTGSLLEDKKEGVLIQDGDPYSMAGAVLELINNIDIAQEYGQEARKRALKRHDSKIIIDQLLIVYKYLYES